MGSGPEPASAPRRGVVLEPACPLSASVIWRAQDRYYEAAGAHAWSSGDVPHTLTSGPMLARSYARVVEAFAADCSAGRLGPVDPDQPLYLLELGAGSGRLAYELLSVLDDQATSPLRVVYLATDRVAANVAAIGSHPKLGALVASGALEVHRYDAGADEPPAPLRRGLANPLVVIANYLFDVIPQDLFVLEGGVLYEELVTTCTEEGVPTAPGERDFFRKIFLATTPREVPAERYGGGALDEILAASARQRPEGRFLFPADALRTLLTLRRLANGRLLSLIGERPGQVPLRRPEEEVVAEAIRTDPEVRPGPAVVRAGGLEALRPGALLSMGIHGGSMSLPVDVGLLSAAAASDGRAVLLPDAPPTALLFAAMLAGERSPLQATRLAYRRAVSWCGPEDLYLMVKAALAAGGAGVPLPQLLALLRTGGYDPYLLRVAYDALASQLAAAEVLPAEDRGELARVLLRVEALDYPLGEEDTAQAVGVLLAGAGAHLEALGCFERSAQRATSAPLLYNLALCQLHLERPAEALGALGDALEIDPGYEPARELAEEVRARRGGGA